MVFMYFTSLFQLFSRPLRAVSGVAPATQAHFTIMPGAHQQHLSKYTP